MAPTTLIAIICAVGFVVSAPANAQALGGTYTCANGNPGGAFDYADIGDFFTGLENFGVSAPVTLEVYDDGGPFLSKSSYQLGFDGTNANFFLRPILGLSASNTITVRAAEGEFPKIVGGGAEGVFPATFGSVKGGMFFHTIEHIAIEGLEVTGGTFGMIWFGGAGSVHISRCKIHNLSGAVAIGFESSASQRIHDVTIENNFMWGCTGPVAIGGVEFGVVYSNNHGSNWVIRNNTVVHISTTGWGWHVFTLSAASSEQVADFSGNIVYLDHVDYRLVFHSFKPLYADHNVVFMLGQARMSFGGTDWSVWQSWGFDANGVNADPQLVSIAPGLEDLRLMPGSPARDLIPSSALTTDVLGNARPWGSGYDAGAHEFNNYPVDVSLAAGSSLAGPVGGPFELTLAPDAVLSDVTIELTDLESEAITITAITPPSPSVSGVNMPAIPTPGHPLVLAWTGALGPSSAPGTHNWTVEFTDAGSGYPRSCTVSITIPPLSITTHSPLPAGQVGTPYSEAIPFANATGTPAFTLQAGTLPPGLNLAATGEITGTPTQPGAYNFTVQAADNFTTLLQAFDVQIDPHPNPIRITTAVLPEGTRGKAYFAGVQTEDATGAVTFTLLSGALPPGLSLGTTGAIFGNPAKAGEFTFTAQAADDFTTATQAYTLQIAPPADTGDSGPGCTTQSQPLWPFILATLLAGVMVGRPLRRTG